MKLVHSWKSQAVNGEDEVLKYIDSSMVLMLFDNEKYYIIPFRGMLKYLRGELSDSDFIDFDLICTSDLDSAIETFDIKVAEALLHINSDEEAPKTDKQEVLNHINGAFESGNPAVLGEYNTNGVSHLIIYIDKDYIINYSLSHKDTDVYSTYCSDFGDIVAAYDSYNEMLSEEANSEELIEYFKLDDLKAEAEKFGINLEVSDGE